MRRRRLIGLIGVVGLVLFAVVLLVAMKSEGRLGKNESVLSQRGIDNNGLPVMMINLNNTSLTEIDENGTDVKYGGNEIELYNKGALSEFDNVEIRGRGNLSWIQPKKSYQIKLDKSVDLLGLGKAKKWVLLANYLDPTYLRNDVALAVAKMIGVDNSHRGDFVELYVDGDYRGLYYVVQKVEIAKGSVDLRNDDGVLFELDNLHRKPTEKCYETYLDECLVLKDTLANNEKENEELQNGFLKDFNNLEKYAKNGQYDKLIQIANIESFAKFFLVNEFVVNPDAYSTSFYLYRGNDGKIMAGPVWDFDLSLANPAWTWWTNENYFSPTVTMFRRDNAFGYGGTEEDLATSRLIYYLMDMPEFRKEVKRVFQEKMEGREQKLIGDIIGTVNKIYWAAKEDGSNWDREDFEKEITEALKWIQMRYRYFEEIYGSKPNQTMNAV